MDAQKYFQSKTFRIGLKIFGALLVALIVFYLGMLVGFHKARYSFGWGDNYHRMFGGPRGGFMQNMMGNDFMNGHGLAGTIVRLDGNMVVIKDQSNTEKIAVIDQNTTIKNGRESGTLADLKVNQQIVIIGSPADNGSINAKIIRLFEPNDQQRFPPQSDRGGFDSGR